MLAPQLQLYYKLTSEHYGIGIKTGTESVEQSPEIKPHIYGQLIYDKDKEVKSIVYNGEIRL